MNQRCLQFMCAVYLPFIPQISHEDRLIEPRTSAVHVCISTFHSFHRFHMRTDWLNQRCLQFMCAVYLPFIPQISHEDRSIEPRMSAVHVYISTFHSFHRFHVRTDWLNQRCMYFMCAVLPSIHSIDFIWRQTDWTKDVCSSCAQFTFQSIYRCAVPPFIKLTYFTHAVSLFG